MPQQIEGSGLLRNLQANTYPPTTARNLAEYGKLVVHSARIGRTPLNKSLRKVLNTTSGGQYNRATRQNGYDDYFHLFILFETDRCTILVEKNESIVVAKGNPSRQKTQFMDIPNFPKRTLNEVMSKTKERQGHKYFRYNAGTNNCQLFIGDLLQANGISDVRILSWVRQNTEAIFRANPSFRKFVNSLTDVNNLLTHAGQTMVETGRWLVGGELKGYSK